MEKEEILLKKSKIPKKKVKYEILPKDTYTYRDFVSIYSKEGKTLSEISQLWKNYKFNTCGIIVDTQIMDINSDLTKKKIKGITTASNKKKQNKKNNPQS